MGRSYTYPHVAALHWVLYRLARNHQGHVTNHPWDWYLERAYQTGEAMVRHAPHYAQFGQMGGSARRYWDFQYAGKLRRVERQLHHYGSGLNATPVLSEYRDQPEDTYLLRVGHAGVIGSIANITEDGFPPAAFHAFPSTLRIDGITGDYGPEFLAYATNTGAYLAHHPDLTEGR